MPPAGKVALSIATGSETGGGTDADVRAKLTCLNGAHSADWIALDKDNYNDFERYDRDDYEVAAPSGCDEVAAVVLDPTPLANFPNERWQVERVTVTDSQGTVRYGRGD
ncbi:PLAT/LH2 domain-containing protein [Streptomyces sp. NPDC005336]|uniref:PLAT/LH2 domain-containing protein n=1 Tax=Streptomyces sp. NPDC005336 TaxID=3157035 RepID=UPI0033A2A388